MRLLWFLDFVYVMVHYLREHPDVRAWTMNHKVGNIAEGGSRGIYLRSKRSTQHAGAQCIPHSSCSVPIKSHIHVKDFRRAITTAG